MTAKLCNKLLKYQYSLDTFYNRLPGVVAQAINYFESCNQFYVNRRCKRKQSKKSFKFESELITINEDKANILKNLNELLIKVKSNDKLVRFNDGQPDELIWNAYLDEYEMDFKKPAKFREMGSIAVESYVYRTMHSIFTTSSQRPFFEFFDPFYQQKAESLNATNLATDLIFSNCIDLPNRMANDDFDLHAEFSNFIGYSLWGNRSDLTIPAGLSACQNFGFTDDLAKRKSNILADSTKEIYDLFQQLKHKDDLKIDVILDNVGLELLSDLCFIEMLYQTKLIKPDTTIRFFVKSFPWFVSDVTSADFVYHLEHLYFRLFKDDPTKEMVLKWNTLIKSRKWQIKVHPFFTTPYEFYKMQRVSPDLYEDLSKSDLLIFKGDLNYVKLLGNLLWPAETPFEIAIQNFKPTNLITLRSAKYNLVVDLKDAKVLDTLPERWYANGDYAMISMYKNRIPTD